MVYKQPILKGIIFWLSLAYATSAHATFNGLTCVDIVDSGANGASDFVVEVVRTATEPTDPNDRFFSAIVKQNVPYRVPPVYKTIGTYRVREIEGEGRYFKRFKSDFGSEFGLNLYESHSLPWADLRIPSKGISRQLECSTKN